MARLFKWVCIEALEATLPDTVDDKGKVTKGKGLGHAKWLVTDRDGTYVGVKLRELPEDARLDLDNCERFEPRKQIKHESLELTRAIKRKMLKVHYPKGADPKKGHKATAIAPDIKAAFAAFGVPTGEDVGGGHPSQSAKQRAEQRQKKKAKSKKKAAKAKPKTTPASAGDDKR